MTSASISARCTSPGTGTVVQPPSSCPGAAAPAGSPSPGAKSRTRAVATSEGTGPRTAPSGRRRTDSVATLLHPAGGQAADDVLLQGEEGDDDWGADDDGGGHELVP